MTSNGNILRGRKMFGRKMRKEAETWAAEIRCHKSSLCTFTRYIHTPRLSAPHFSANPVRQSTRRNAEGSAKRQKHGWQKYGAIKVRSAVSHGTFTPLVFLPHIFLPTPSNNPANRNAEGSAKRQQHGWQKYGAIKVRSAPSHGTSTPLVFLPHIFLPNPSDNPPAAMQKDPQKGKNMGGRSAVPQKLTARLHTLPPHPPRLSAPHFSANPVRQSCQP